MMKAYRNQSFLDGIPSWVSALITMIVVFVAFMAIPEGTISNDPIFEELIVFIAIGILNAVCCFFIVRHNPKSIWYVPLIINAVLIIAGFFEPYDLNAWIPVIGVFAVSAIASIIGSRIGKKTN